MAGIIDHFFDIVLLSPQIAALGWLHYGLYVAVRILGILFSFLLLLLSIQAVNRAYESKDRYMERRELVMLTVPSLSGIAGYAIFHFYQIKSEMTGFFDVLCFILSDIRNGKHQYTRGYKRYKEMFQICRVEKSDFPLYFYILAGCAD